METATSTIAEAKHLDCSLPSVYCFICGGLYSCVKEIGLFVNSNTNKLITQQACCKVGDL